MIRRWLGIDGIDFVIQAAITICVAVVLAAANRQNEEIMIGATFAASFGVLAYRRHWARKRGERPALIVGGPTEREQIERVSIARDHTGKDPLERFGLILGEKSDAALSTECAGDHTVRLARRAKHTLHRQLELLQEQSPFSLTWGRLFYLYGEGQAPTSLWSQLRAAIARGDAEFKMSAGEQLRDFLPIAEAAGHRLASLVVGEVNEPVRGKLRVQRDFLQPSGSKRRLLRSAADRLGLEPWTGPCGAAHQTQPPTALGHECISVGEEREAERVRQAGGDDDHADLVLFGGVIDVRSRPDGDGGDAERRRLLRPHRDRNGRATPH